MTLVRVTVAGTIGKAVRINTAATVGSQIGVDFQLPDGTTPTLAELADALYVQSPPGEFVPNTGLVAGGHSHFESEIIDGVLLARVADNEVITGAYRFDTNLTMGNAVPINWKDAFGTKVQFLNLSASGGALGAEVGHVIVKSFASQQTTSGTYVNKTGATIAHASLTDNEDYLVIAKCTAFNVTSQSTSVNGVRLTYNGSVVSGGEKLWEGVIGITDQRGMPYSWCGIIASGSAGDLQIQFKSGNGSDTIDCGFVTILAIKVSDLILNTNIFFDADTATIELDDGNFPPTNFETLGAGITIGDGTSDYLVFAGVWIGDFESGGNTVTWNLRESNGDTLKLGGVYGMSDVTDEIPMMHAFLYKAQAATTLTIEATCTGFPVDAKRSFLAAIRLNAFAEHFVGYDADPDESTWSFPQARDIATISATATVSSSNWGFIAAANDSWGGASPGRPTTLVLDIDGAGDVIVGGDSTWELETNSTSRRETRFMVSADQTINSGETIDADCNIQTNSNPQGDAWKEALIVGFTWELQPSGSFKVGDPNFLTQIFGTSVDIPEPLNVTGTLSIFDSGGSDSLAMAHDGTKFDFTFVNTSEVKFSGVNTYTFDRLISIVPSVAGQGFSVNDPVGNATMQYKVFEGKMTGAGAAMYRLFGMPLVRVDTDLDVTGALTAVSYGGILEANLLDKTASETWTGAELRFNDNKKLKFGNSGDVAIDWDSSDFTIQGTSGTFIITGFNIAAGTIDADFDAITATSYGAILEANLLDKTATEDITGSYTFSVGPTFFSAGTEGAPGIAFDGDPDTGAYSPGANIFAITVGGVEAVRWTGASIPIVDYALDSGIAASTTQTQGQQLLTASYNEISTVANDNDVVTLPTCKKGRFCLVINTGANKLQLFPSSGDNLGQGVDSSTTVEPNSALLFIGSDPTNWREADNNKTYRIGHTYGVISKIKIPNGDKDFIIPFFVSLASGQTVKLVKARHKINVGTSVTCKLQKNGVDITGFTGILITTTAADTDPADVTLADNDKLALVVTGTSGNPQNMSFTIFLEYTT